MKKWKLHPGYVFRYVKYGVVLCAVPIVQAILQWSWSALQTAIVQNAIILVAVFVAGLLIWAFTSIELFEEGVTIQTGVFIRHRKTFLKENITAVVVERPMRYRLTGGSKVSLYFKTAAYPSAYSVPLTKAHAEDLLNNFIPLAKKEEEFRFSGMEKLNNMMLSVNFVTTAFYVFMTGRRFSQTMDDFFTHDTWQGFVTLENIVEQVLPTGLTAVIAIILFVYGYGVLKAALQQAGLVVEKYSNALVASGGVLTTYERRILYNEITSCEVKINWPSRILRNYPVYVHAGGYLGDDLPLTLYNKNNVAKIKQIVPQFVAPTQKYSDPIRKSIWQYLWRPLAMFGVSAGGLSLAYLQGAPALYPVFGLPIILSLFYLYVSVEGIFKEGVRKTPSGVLSLSRAGFLNRYVVTFCTDDISQRSRTTSAGILSHRCSVTFFTSEHKAYHVRGIDTEVAMNLLK